MRHEAPNASSHKILSCLPNPPGQVFPHLSQQAGKGAVRPACSRIGQQQGGNQRHSRGKVSPVDLLVDVIEVIRVIWGITTTGVIRVRFPIRDRLDRLAS